MIDTEAGCLDLARRIMLRTIEVRVQHFAAVRGLVISRYDRIVLPRGCIRRVHQEDAGQALGINTNLAVRNTDAHAKNISILRPTVGPAKLAPA